MSLIESPAGLQSLPRSGGALPQAAARSTKQKHGPSQRPLRLRTLVILVIVVGVLGLAGGGWLYLHRTPANANPFTAEVIASLKFPVYYPTDLPPGYRIDPQSVTEPQANVVVFNLIGPHGEKLYVSEEARPSKFNLGGFYNQWVNMREVGVSDGAVAVGYADQSRREEVVSRANNTTWILANTKASIPFDQLINMLKSIVVAY